MVTITVGSSASSLMVISSSMTTSSPCAAAGFDPARSASEDAATIRRTRAIFASGPISIQFVLLYYTDFLDFLWRWAALLRLLLRHLLLSRLLSRLLGALLLIEDLPLNQLVKLGFDVGYGLIDQPHLYAAAGGVNVTRL